MRASSLCDLRSADADELPIVYDAVVEFLKADLTRARWIISQHIPDHCGWCYHQGAHEQYRWPCELFQCAQAAVIAVAPQLSLLSKVRNR